MAANRMASLAVQAGQDRDVNLPTPPSRDNKEVVDTNKQAHLHANYHFSLNVLNSLLAATSSVNLQCSSSYTLLELTASVYQVANMNSSYRISFSFCHCGHLPSTLRALMCLSNRDYVGMTPKWTWGATQMWMQGTTPVWGKTCLTQTDILLMHSLTSIVIMPHLKYWIVFFFVVNGPMQTWLGDFWVQSWIVIV
ncbi:hypothetical protein B0H10DRAFT_1958003 [Mycena sp. CBHHK59/15]|nr:hypothetical protein B0H10DRAFT_1958003 [Mycena sp. CBHHK59/15]